MSTPKTSHFKFLHDRFRRDGSVYPPGVKGTREWARDMEDPAQRVVVQCSLPNGYQVSTVWLGLPRNFLSLDQVPLIFETMVFHHSKTDYQSYDVEWYSTEAAARIGHAAMVLKWQTQTHPPDPNAV